MGLDRDAAFLDTILSGWNGGIVLNLATASYKFALFTSSLSANFSQTSPTYNVSPLNSGEVTGTGYTAGGVALSSVSIAENGSSAGTIKFTAATVSWTSASFTAHGGLVYLTSMSNRAFIQRTFGSDLVVQDGTFTVTWHTNGILSLPCVGSVIG